MFLLEMDLEMAIAAMVTIITLREVVVAMVGTTLTQEEEVILANQVAKFVENRDIQLYNTDIEWMKAIKLHHNTTQGMDNHFMKMVVMITLDMVVVVITKIWPQPQIIIKLT